jgi:hypothetical protein
MHKFLFYSKIIIFLYMFRPLCVHHQEVKIVLYSIWYHHTETSEWSKITKIYKYEYIVVKFIYVFYGCDYCILLTINVLWHVQFTFIQLLNLLKIVLCLFKLHICWAYPVIKSYKLFLSCCIYKFTFIQLLNLLIMYYAYLHYIFSEPI